MPVRRLAALTLCGLAAASLAMAGVTSPRGRRHGVLQRVGTGRDGLIDRLGIGLEDQFLVMALYTVAGASLFRLLAPRLRYVPAT